jgi:segregation and condensation protein A
MADELKITLSHYEGPLDLLLDLIRRQKIDIYDIPIAQVTSQYLDFLHLMKEMNVDVAAEFLVIAAQLIYIKSRLLLPPDPDADPEEEDDPRGELVRRLLEYEQFKNAAEMLYQREQVEKAAWTRAGVIDIDEADLEPEVIATLFDMLDVFRDVLKRFEELPPLDVFREELSIEQMANFVLEELSGAIDGIRFTQLLERFSTRKALITVFLALLELARLRAIYLEQNHALEDIEVRANPTYERSQSFSLT